MNQRLLSVGPDGRAETGLVDRWTRSADGLTWRFTLRPDLQFHNGTPMDADHVAAGLREQIAKGFTGVGLREIVDVTAEGSATVVVHLRQPSSLLLEAIGGLSITTGKGPSLSAAGPFQLVSREKDHAQLRAFTKYFRGRPSIDMIDVHVYPNARNAWSAMMRGEADFLYDVAPEATDFVEQSSQTEVRSFLRPYVYTLAMSMRHPVLRNRDVRVAMSRAVNRTEIIEKVFGGRGYPASSHLWPRHWAYDHMQPHFRFQPTQSAQALDDAGYPVRALPTGPPAPRFSFVCLMPDGDLRYERIGLLLQRQLIDVGVDMQLQTVPPLDLAKRMAAGDYDAVLLDLVATSRLTYIYDVWHSPGKAPVYIFDSGYTATDTALDELQLANTDDEVRAAVHKIQRVMHEDPPAIFLCWGETARAVSSRFRVPLVLDRDVAATVAQWRLAPPSR